MFSRFTEKAIQSIMLAQEEAKRFHHNYVGTEHILLGLIGEPESVICKVLDDLGVSPDHIRDVLEDRLEYGGLEVDSTNIPFTQQAKQVLSSAWDEARKLGHNYVNVEHLFLSLFRDSSNIAAKVLTEAGLDPVRFKDTLFTSMGSKTEEVKAPVNTVPTPTLDLYGRDLTWLAKDKKLDPVVGRHEEIERIIQILSRRTKNNPVLNGEPGVGKTAVVEGLAQKIVAKEVPDKLVGKRVITLDLGLLVAGTKYRGEFEDRVKKIMEEVRKAKNVILFIDELHTIIGTGGSEGSLDAANLFKPALARGELQCIGATTLDEYRKHIEGDGALERRFQAVLVEQPSTEETIDILRGIKGRYEEYHGVEITDESLHEAVRLSTRFITDRQLPDKAVDVIDEAASKVMLRVSSAPEELKKLSSEKQSIRKELEMAEANDDKSLVQLLRNKQQAIESKLGEFSKEDLLKARNVVDVQAVTEVVAMWTGIPITKVSEEESHKLLQIEDELHKKIIGQDEAVSAVARAIKRAKVGLKDPGRPTGSFLFLGPTGVGKSEMAKTLAEYLFGDKDALIRIDMTEYMEKHSLSRLIGSPPGYVGYNEGGQLTEPIRRKPYSIVLFDELEKASPEVINILLQILDDGRLTDSNGRVVDFKNTIVVMTSNVGAKYIEKESSFGFTSSEDKEEADYKQMKSKLQDELRENFKPEFINRIDDIVIFKPLPKEVIRSIVEIMIDDVAKRLSEKDIRIKADDKVKDYLVENGYNARQGARPLRRAIQELFEDKLADVLLKKNLRSGLSVSATIKNDDVKFTVRTVKPKAPEKHKTVKAEKVTLGVKEPEPEPAVLAPSASDSNDGSSSELELRLS